MNDSPMRQIFHRQILSAAICLAMTGMAAADTVIVKDASGREVTVKDSSRIVSIGGAVTEILYALGLQDRIAAVDTTSAYPPAALKEKPNVGYMRALSPEGVLGLAPTLILAIEGTGPKQTMSVLEAANVPIVLVPDPFSGEGIVEKVRMIAQVTGVEARGRCLADKVRADLDALNHVRSNIRKPMRVMFVLSFVGGRAMVAGQKTAADGIIRMAGAVNAIGEYEGYKAINDEGVVAAKPDAVLVMSRSSGEQLTAETIFAHPAFTTTPAAVNKSYVLMDGLYLLGFGPRTALAARDLAFKLYPDLKPETFPSEGKAVAADACAK
jgi:iron complex transport system substrate-binding protein